MGKKAGKEKVEGFSTTLEEALKVLKDISTNVASIYDILRLNRQDMDLERLKKSSKEDPGLSEDGLDDEECETVYVIATDSKKSDMMYFGGFIENPVGFEVYGPSGGVHWVEALDKALLFCDKKGAEVCSKRIAKMGWSENYIVGLKNFGRA